MTFEQLQFAGEPVIELYRGPFMGISLGMPVASLLGAGGTGDDISVEEMTDEMVLLGS
ncbi:MAG: hypothetical protein ABH830_01560 [Patescibacteria group bacterium]